MATNKDDKLIALRTIEKLRAELALDTSVEDSNLDLAICAVLDLLQECILTPTHQSDYRKVKCWTN